ncbi:acyltransferase [Sphingomonas sp. AR_OL41]|uniref:acyltransferase family protein n=1 Tax=Sphingomonas sp. AR_OL41 TaxID=3042729 RepID=UPI0024811846|nr:acyltransferase [Sphingomonas sp. AR_OL41]MDH7974652.1 acyltransferase [Sphingomonas sp. AR_OL41]
MATMAEKLAASGGRPSGFDYLRLALAIGVIAVHSAIVSYNFPGEIALWLSPARPVVRAILPMFFALSGFLVAGSLERSRTLGMFLGLRAIRIYPALAVEALLSALILGPIFTKYTLAGYVHDPLFAHYFWNLIGDPQSMLPGVFAHNPLPDYMNRQLWTVPFELLCYITLAALAVLGVKRRPILLPLAALGIALGYGAIKLWKTGAILYVVGPLPGLLLVVAFLCGVAIYLYRERIPCTPAWFIGAVVASALLLTVVPSGDLFAPFTTAYVAVWLGLTNGPRLWFIRGADYSYGIFLYGFPMQQAVAAAIGPWAQTPVINTIASTAAAAAFAGLSWTYIEKPALRLRRPMERMEARWLGRGVKPVHEALAPRPLDQ